MRTLILLLSFSLTSAHAQWARPEQVPLDILRICNNDGIAMPPNIKDGNFDCPNHPPDLPGSAFPGLEMPLPGTVLSVKADREVDFLFTSQLEGEFNNTACNGQWLKAEEGNYTDAYILGAAENGHQVGGFVVGYAEGSFVYNVGFSDWCGEAKFGETVAAEYPYRYTWNPATSEMVKEPIKCRLWVQRLRLDSKKKLHSITLPLMRRIHIFAITLVAPTRTKEIEEAKKETLENYNDLRTHRPVFSTDLRVKLRSLRDSVNAAIQDSKFNRELGWMLSNLDYADYIMPMGRRRLLHRTAKYVEWVLYSVRKDLQELEEGRNPFPKKRGQFLRSYYSPVDDSLQTYSVSVPANYQGAVKYPLLVQLHGHGGHRPFLGFPTDQIEGVIMLAPQGRGSTDYMRGAEEDVLRTIEEVQKDYNIDPNWIILEGRSMGGTGTWNIGAKFPDRFACLSPVMGNTDNEVFYVDRKKPEPPETFKDLYSYLQQVNSPFHYAPNLSNIPILCAHGKIDTVVRVEHSQRMIARLLALGSKPLYYEIPDIGHGGFSKEFYDQRWKWMFSHRRNPRPAKVHWRTPRLRYSGAYWLRVNQLEHWGMFGEVAGEQISPSLVRLTTGNPVQIGGRIVYQSGNVSAVTVLTEHLPEKPSKPLNIMVDDALAYSGTPKKELHLSRINSKWQEAEAHPEELSKKPALEGPVDDALRSPFIIVYGTVSDKAVWNRMNRTEAEAMAINWEEKFRIYPRVKADVDITDKDIESLNLFLFGGSKENAITARVAQALPIKAVEGGYEFGGEIFKGESIGYRMCYPNPLQPDHYVVVTEATDPFTVWQIGGRFGNATGWEPFDGWNWFDFAIFDQRSGKPETMLISGFFGPNWQIDPKSTWRGNEQSRATVNIKNLPQFTSTDEAGEGPLPLSRLLPARIRQRKGPLSIDRSFEGRPLHIGKKLYSSGLGVRPPSLVEYELKAKYTKLVADIGADPEGLELDVRKWFKFSVKGDGRTIWSSEWLNSDHAADRIEVDITGIDKLELQVEGGGASWLFGSAAWGDARVMSNE
ncbi:MAG: NPCBM/NEW2 domain-containing protein [Planctomycetota bacterium]|nr:NPCBM/NEW2 domain-containing protein [Planctomycetota bacterium]